MKILDNLLKKRNYTDQQLEDATNLVSLATALAVSSYIPLLKKYPELEEIAKGGYMEKWDFLMTIVGVGVAFSRLANPVNENHINGYSNAVKQALDNLG